LAERVSPGWGKAGTRGETLTAIAATAIVRSAKALESATVFASKVIVPAAHQLVLRTRMTLTRLSAIPFLLRLRLRMAQKLSILVSRLNPGARSARPMTHQSTTRAADFVKCKAEGANV
ncbi:MAG TPA: hypothetical protein VH196_00815, partial [Terriglobales bacterium]|nr:hypothetical protein [Terriglobales bacterium]